MRGPAAVATALLVLSGLSGCMVQDLDSCQAGPSIAAPGGAQSESVRGHVHLWGRAMESGHGYEIEGWLANGCASDVRYLLDCNGAWLGVGIERNDLPHLTGKLVESGAGCAETFLQPRTLESGKTIHQTRSWNGTAYFILDNGTRDAWMETPAHVVLDLSLGAHFPDRNALGYPDAMYLPLHLRDAT
jgi:hypothetical protein